MRHVIVSLLFYSVFFSIAFTRASECLPENKLSFPAGLKNTESLSEFEVRQLVDRFSKSWSPWVAKEMRKKLIVNLDWESDRVNAHATRDDLDNPVIVILGGMARHPQLSKDGLLLILCHELGHHLGGAPRKFRGNSELRTWSSAEGQADYFATTKCLPRIFTDITETRFSYELPDELEIKSAEDRCAGNLICARSLMAGLSVGKVFASLKPWWKDPSLSRSDSGQVSRTNYAHPRPQCRLDTYLAGALCDNHDQEFDPVDPRVGACIRKENGFHDRAGSRPLCWYRPRNQFK